MSNWFCISELNYDEVVSNWFCISELNYDEVVSKWFCISELNYDEVVSKWFCISELNYDEVVSKSPIGRLLFTDFCNETEELRCCNKFLNDVVSSTSNLTVVYFLSGDVKQEK